MSSILTNTSAMNALSTLRGVNDRLGETQNRISTGLKVNSAKDNASYFSISTTMDSESGMNKAINSGLTLAKNSVSTGRLGAETMVDLAQQFVDRLAFAQTEGVDQDAIQKELSSLAAQMKTSIAQSSFNGENLLTAAGSGPKEIVSGVSRSGGSLSTTVIKYDATNLEAVQASFEAFSIDNTTSSADLQTALQTAEGFLSTVTGAATDLGIAEKSIETQQNFLSELTNRLDSGVGSMIDAEIGRASCRERV